MKELREEIDGIDYKIIDLLKKRFLIAKKIGKIKKEQKIEILQPSRWNDVLISRKKYASKNDVNEELIEQVWNLLHKEALNQENKNV